MDFAILADHRVKNKENKKGDKYLVIARKLFPVDWGCRIHQLHYCWGIKTLPHQQVS